MIETKSVTAHLRRMVTKPEQLLPNDFSEQMRPEQIGYRLSLLRKAYDLTPSQISDMLGIERTYWSRFENGKRAVTDTVAALLVARFGVTLDFLILGRWDGLPLSLAENMRELESKKR